jgi:hypothetical protein
MKIVAEQLLESNAVESGDNLFTLGEPDATATLAVFVPRHSKMPQNSPSECL